MARKVETSLNINTSTAIKNVNDLILQMRSIKSVVDEISKLKISFEIPANLKELYKLKNEAVKQNEKSQKSEEEKTKKLTESTEKELTNLQKLNQLKKQYIESESAKILAQYQTKDKLNKQEYDDLVKSMSLIRSVSKEKIDSLQKQQTKQKEVNVFAEQVRKIEEEAKRSAQEKALASVSGITDEIEKRKELKRIIAETLKGDTSKTTTKTTDIPTKKTDSSDIEKTRDVYKEISEYIKKIATERADTYAQNRNISKESEEYKRAFLKFYEEEKNNLNAKTGSLKNMKIIEKEAMEFARQKAIQETTHLTNSVEKNAEMKRIYKETLATKKQELEYQQLEKNGMSAIKEAAMLKVDTQKSIIEQYKQYKSEINNTLKGQKEVTQYQQTEREGLKEAKKLAYEKVQDMAEGVNKYKAYKEALKDILKTQKESKEKVQETAKETKKNSDSEIKTQAQALKAEKDKLWQKILQNKEDKSKTQLLKEFEKEYGKLKSEIKPISLFTETTMMTQVANQIKSFASSYLTTLMDLENSIYNLGVVSGKSLYQFSDLRREMLEMSREFPYTASELAKVIETLVRTGRTYAESKTIIESVGRLAMATGDDLKSTADIVTKIFTALKIDAKNTEKILDTLHSTALMTATDMGKLGEAYKNVGASLSSFVEMSDLTGEALDNYKQSLIELGNTSLGIFANMGKSASNAGVLVRNLTTKMIALEKTAKNMLTEDITGKVFVGTEKSVDTANKAGGQITTKEIKISFDEASAKTSLDNVRELTIDTLQQIAKQDLPKAVEIFSELYSKGLIRTETMMKIFTVRQGSATASLFSQMGAGYEELNQYINHSRKVQEDYEKQLNNINNQLKIFQNNVFELGKGAGAYLLDSMNTYITLGKVLTNVLQDLNKETEVNTSSFKSFGLGALDGIGAFASAAGQGIIATTGLTFAITGLQKVWIAARSTNPYFFAIATALTLINIVGMLIKKHKEEEAALIQKEIASKKAYDTAMTQYKMLELRLKGIATNIKNLSELSENINELSFDKIILSLDDFYSKIKDIKEVLEKSELFENFIKQESLDKQISKIEELNKSLQNIKISEEYKDIEKELINLANKAEIIATEINSLKLDDRSIKFRVDRKSIQDIKSKFGDIIDGTDRWGNTFESSAGDPVFEVRGLDNYIKILNDTSIKQSLIYHEDKKRVKNYRNLNIEMQDLQTKENENSSKQLKLTLEAQENIQKYMEQLSINFTEVNNAIEKSKMETVMENISNMDFKNIDEFGEKLRALNFEGFGDSILDGNTVKNFKNFSDDLQNVFKGLNEETFSKVFKNASTQAKLLGIHSLEASIESLKFAKEFKEEKLKTNDLGDQTAEQIKKEIQDAEILIANEEGLKDLKLENLKISVKQQDNDANHKDVLYKILHITHERLSKEIELYKLKNEDMKAIKLEEDSKKKLLAFELAQAVSNKSNLIEQISSSKTLKGILDNNREGQKALSNMTYDELKAQYDKIDKLKQGNKINVKINELRQILLGILNEEDKIKANALAKDIVDLETTKQTYEYQKKIRDKEYEISKLRESTIFENRLSKYKIETKYLEDIEKLNSSIKDIKQEEVELENKKGKGLFTLEDSLRLEELGIKKISINSQIDNLTTNIKDKLEEGLSDYKLSTQLFDFSDEDLTKIRNKIDKQVEKINTYITGDKLDLGELTRENAMSMLKGLNEKGTLNEKEITVKQALIELLKLEKEYTDKDLENEEKKYDYGLSLLKNQREINKLYSKKPEFVQSILNSKDAIRDILKEIRNTRLDKTLTPSQKKLKISELKVQYLNVKDALDKLKTEIKQSIEENKITLKYKDDVFGLGNIEKAQKKLIESNKAYDSFRYDKSLTYEENFLQWEKLRTDELIAQYELEKAKTESLKSGYDMLVGGMNVLANSLKGTAMGAGLQTTLGIMGSAGQIGSAYSNISAGMSAINLGTANAGTYLGMAGSYAQAIGAGIQIGNALMFGDSQSKIAKAQEEYQKNQTKLDEYRNKLLENQNGLMSEFVNQATKIGTKRAIEQSLSSVKDITGVGSSEYSKSVSTGIGKSKNVSVLKTANVGLSDLGISIDNMKTLTDLEEARAKALQKMSEGQQKVNSLSLSSKTWLNFNKDLYEQARAELMAYMDLHTNLDNYIIQATENLKEITKSYFGAVLEEVKDDNDVITSYVANWAEFLANVNSDIVSSFTGTTKAIGSVISNLFSGFRNNLVQNNIDIIKITDSIVNNFEIISTSLANGAEISSESIQNIIQDMEDLKESQKDLNDVSRDFIKMYLTNGGDISDIYSELGTYSQTVYDSISSAFASEDYDSLVNNFGSGLFKGVFDSFYEEALNQKYASQILAISDLMTNAINEGSVESLSVLSQEAQRLSIAMEQDRLKFEALKSLSKYEKDIEYTSDNSNITYDTGTSTQTVYNYYITSNINGGVIIGTSDELEELTRQQGDFFISTLKEDKGIDLEKLR